MGIKGQIAWNKGTKGLIKPNKGSFKKGEHRSVLTEFKKGSMIRWKGEDASYQAKHMWIYKKLGQPDTCSKCKKSKLKGKKIHWANKSGKYLRDLNDWIRLCSKCHVEYDKVNNLRKFYGQGK